MRRCPTGHACGPPKTCSCFPPSERVGLRGGEASAPATAPGGGCQTTLDRLSVTTVHGSLKRDIGVGITGCGPQSQSDFALASAATKNRVISASLPLKV